MRRHLSLLAAAALVVACSNGADDADGIALDGADDAPAELEATDDPADEADASDTDATEDVAPDATDGSQDGDASPTGDVVDGTEAVPGTWQVGEAGTVTFDVVDGALVLEDVSENEGWTVTDIEEEPDEIEVDFQRGAVEIEIEIEIASGGTILEVEIDTDIENADPGTYAIGDAGEFTFDVVDGQLELTDLTVSDGWEITEQDVESDEIEIELRNGAMRWDADVDLNGSAEIELDYEVSGQL